VLDPRSPESEGRAPDRETVATHKWPIWQNLSCSCRMYRVFIEFATIETARDVPDFFVSRV
jgi:hypothetical protein